MRLIAGFEMPSGGMILLDGADISTLPADMKDAPELVVPVAFADKVIFIPTCSPKAQEYITAIGTELQK